ncbi:MAG: flagellar protein [Lachnospiraceae bacterium]|nr:flagellar protein [Lachnospiraceae bacterium]
MNINNSQFLSNLQIQEAILGNQTIKETRNVPRIDGNHKSFDEILQKKLEDNRGEVRFSKHAMTRLENRNITLSDLQMNRLNEGARKAGEKGIKESLVLVDELAFIVNTEHKTVVTAMDQGTNEENIFTNIDGAVIA